MIKFDNIQIKYGDFIAIDNLNLEINEGEFFTFLGPSGCGKSTTLRALVGFLDPSAGRIEVNGKDITKLEPEKRGIGIVFQSYALFPTMTVFDNIAFGLKVKKVAPDVIKAKVAAVAAKIKISDQQLKRNVSELSGGQQQRVCIAGAIILSPKLIICDEPIASLDLAIQVQILDLINKINQEEGISFIFITHNLPAVYRIADRILLLYHGEVQEIQEVEEFFRNPKSEYGKKFLKHLNLIKNF